MLSLYTSAFNVVRNGFAWREALENFSLFADEVIIAVNTSDDNTEEILSQYCDEKKYRNVWLTSTNFSYDDPLFDGKIKNAALQACRGELLVGVDFDERIPVRHKERWRQYGRQLLSSLHDAYLIPMVNLWGDARTIRKDQYSFVKTKWYLHRRGLNRGVVNFAKLPNGKIDVKKSDTCELIYADGQLVNSTRLIKQVNNEREYYKFLETMGLFVFHTGYIDFANTVEKNKKFWKQHWELRSGQSYKMPTRVADMEHYKTVPHGLKLWNE